MGRYVEVVGQVLKVLIGKFSVKCGLVTPIIGQVILVVYLNIPQANASVVEMYAIPSEQMIARAKGVNG